MSENKFDMTSLVLDSIDKRLLDEYEYVLKDGKTMLVDPATSPFGEPVEMEGPISFTVPENTRADKELKSLISKAEGIDLPPSRSLLGIPIPTRDKLRSNVTRLASSLGVPMGASQFISDLVAGPMGIDFGVADLTGFGELIDAVNGFSKMQSGLAQDDPGTAVEGMVEGTFGGVGLKLLGNELFEKLKPKAKEALGFLAGKAREYKANQQPGTKLLSTDPTDPTVDAIIKLDEMVNPKKVDGVPEVDPFIKDTIETVEPDYKNQIKQIALTRNPEVKDKENPKILTEDLHKFYDNLAIKKHGRKLNIENPDDYNTVKAELVQSIQQQVKKEVSGKGWYDADVLKTFNLLSRTPGFERLGEDETHRVILSAILGATSPGPKVAQNTKAGLAQYLQWARTGKFSTEAIKPGGQVEGIKNPGFGQYGYPDGLKMLQFLLDKFGEEGFADFMLSPKTKGELTKLRLEAGFKSGPAGMSGTADSLHLGMNILGDKAGKFALNINGYPSTTKDRWFVRTIRRSEGTFGDNLVKKVDKKKGTEKMVELGQPRNQSERLIMDQLVKDIIADPALADLNLTEQDAQAILWFREQTLQNDLGVPTYPETFSEGVGKVNEQKGFGIFASDEDKVAIEQGTISPEGFRGISARQRTVRDNRRLQLLNNPEGDGGSSKPYTRESETDDGRSGLLSFQPNPEVLSRYNKAGLNIPVVNQVDPKTSANSFSSDMASAMVDHFYGKQVTIQDPNNLLDAKLYRTEFGGGFAIKPDGDIIGVFQGANAPPKTSYAMIQLAVEQGGKKLDAFNTMLPRIYETLGFRPVSRVKWDDTQAPDGWNKETFAEYNNGEPDLVFFVYDPNYFGGAKIDELPIFTDYDEAQKIQTKALEELGGNDGSN